MHPVVVTLGDELRENRCHRGALGSAADVVLARRRCRGVDHELLGVRVVGGGGLQMLDVATVTGLCHRETAQQIQGDERPHIGVVMPFGAEILDGAPNRPHSTPALTISDRSDIASIAIFVTAAPASPVPHAPSGKPSSACPAAAMIFSWALTVPGRHPSFGVKCGRKISSESFADHGFGVTPAAVESSAGGSASCGHTLLIPNV